MFVKVLSHQVFWISEGLVGSNRTSYLVRIIETHNKMVEYIHNVLGENLRSVCETKRHREMVQTAQIAFKRGLPFISVPNANQVRSVGQAQFWEQVRQQRNSFPAGVTRPRRQCAPQERLEPQKPC